MGTSIITSTPRNLNSAAIFNDWVARVENGILASGAIRVNTTGDLGLVSSFSIGSTPNSYGFRIYELNDRYSIDTPVYFKVFFYAHPMHGTASTFTQGMLGVQVGFEIDTSGNFIGAVIPDSPQITSAEVQNGAPVLANQCSSVATRSEDGFFAYFGDIGAGYVYSENITTGGFAIERRIDSQGVVYPGHIVLFVTSATYLAASVGAMRFLHVNKSGAKSTSYRSNPSSLPTSTFDGAMLIARQFEATDIGAFHQSKHLVAVRSGTAWSELVLSFDGVVGHDFMLLPMLSVSGNPLNSLTGLGVNARLDTRETSVGFLGLRWE